MLEPLQMRPWEIAEMTDEQILMAVAASARRQRDDKGTPQYFDPEKTTEDEQFEMHAALGRQLGATADQIVAQWNATHPGNERSVPSREFPPSREDNASDAMSGEKNPALTRPGKRSMFAPKGGGSC